MTEVTFFEDFYCFEYHSHQEATQRFRYYLYSPVYVFSPVVSTATSHWEYSLEKAVYSNDFLPGRFARHARG